MLPLKKGESEEVSLHQETKDSIDFLSLEVVNAKNGRRAQNSVEIKEWLIEL